MCEAHATFRRVRSHFLLAAAQTTARARVCSCCDFTLIFRTYRIVNGNPILGHILPRCVRSGRYEVFLCLLLCARVCPRCFQFQSIDEKKNCKIPCPACTSCGPLHRKRPLTRHKKIISTEHENHARSQLHLSKFPLHNQISRRRSLFAYLSPRTTKI